MLIKGFIYECVSDHITLPTDIGKLKQSKIKNNFLNHFLTEEKYSYKYNKSKLIK